MTDKVGTETTDRASREPLVALRKVATYLGVSRQTLYRWRELREGPPSYQVGRGVKYRMTEVDDWLKQQQATAETA